MFAETLKTLRLSRHMTQTEVANMLGVSLRSYQNYENGHGVPRDETILLKLSDYFDVPLKSLISSDDVYRLLRTEARQKLKSEDDRTELYRLLQEVTTLFAGGDLSDSDRELFLTAVTELYRETREEAREDPLEAYYG